MKRLLLRFAEWKYRYILTPILFRFDSETIHEFALSAGKLFGAIPLLPRFLAWCIGVRSPQLSTTIGGVTFSAPVGLAAGFDYTAKLPMVLSVMGFGFGTIGTLSNMPYEGNPTPRLGRLVRSRSLLVNKGFKNNGIEETLATLRGKHFPVPVGVSIGRTNTLAHATQAEAAADVVQAFQKAESSSVPFSYYELNISCPNLRSPIEFYAPEHLRELLDAVMALRVSRPIFIKMPISLPDEEIIAILDVLSRYPIAMVIIGNLQKNRSHPSVVQDELAKYPKGNLSGLPCRDRSDELIALTYRHTGGKLPIIGCGGVFSAEDAYRKIRRGASLVQLVTGLVFYGPFLPARIAADLVPLLSRDGFIHLSDAVGVDASS